MKRWNTRNLVVIVTAGLLLQSHAAVAQVVARTKSQDKSTSTMFANPAKKYKGWTLAQMNVKPTSQGTNTLKIDDLRKADEKEKDVDNEITDARLRAQLGSKSKWSFKSSLAYAGGSVERPFDAVRPNYRASADIESMTSLAGDLGLNFRLTDKDNIGIGTGLTIVDPFHGDISKPVEDPRNENAESIARYQFSTPFINWSRGYRVWDTQMISSLTYGHATDSDSLKLSKTFGSLGFSQTILKNFGSSGWNGGASISVSKYFYSGEVDDSNMIKKMQAGTYKRPDVGSGLFPFVQYQFNDTYSFRTIFGYFQFMKYETEDQPIQMEPYQSVGVGISITRDIYIYPNVQFTPKDMRADRTNVALSTNINLF
jgi:hypothetical protein